MITMRDAMAIVAKKLPDEGVTYREFVTRTCKLRGENDDVIEATIKLAEQDGIMEDDIVKIGPCGTKMQ